ncbi:TrkA C-terminal domain-containing protein [Brasilonema sp. CT11]|nr:TrkA C-terminal domain-containing protein [Brasilonema sp. CT11]
MFQEKDLIEPSLIGVFIEPNSTLCGVCFTDIPLPENCVLLGIVREGKVIPATENPTIYPEDEILAVAIHPMMAPALKVTLKKTRPIYSSSNKTCLISAKRVANSTDITQKTEASGVRSQNGSCTTVGLILGLNPHRLYDVHS